MSHVIHSFHAGLHFSLHPPPHQGLSVFCPTPKDRVHMLSSLVTRCMKERAHISSSGPITGLTGAAPSVSDLSSAASQREGEVRDMLLQRYFNSVSTPRQVLSLLTLLEASGGAAEVDQDLSSLLNSCFAYLLQHAETAILDAVSPQGAAGVRLPDHVGAVRDFLLRTLSAVFSRAVRSIRPADPYFRFATSFSRRVIAECSDLLSFCAKAGAWPTDPAAATPKMLEGKARSLRALQSIVGAVLTLVTTVLSGLCLNTEAVTSLVPPLVRLGTAVDALAIGLPEVVSAEHDYAAAAVKWTRSKKSVVVETPHPVGTTSWTHLVTVPGAASMVITFEDQSMQSLNSVRLPAVPPTCILADLRSVVVCLCDPCCSLLPAPSCMLLTCLCASAICRAA